MSFGDGDLHVQVAQLKTENARLRQQVDKLRELPEIVRCRDCAYSHTDEFGVLRCTGELVEPWDYYNDEPSAGAKIALDGFCAWGVRKEGGDD